MSILIDCPHCSYKVGVLDLAQFVKVGITNSSVVQEMIESIQAAIVDCSCHCEPNITKTKKLLGLIEQTKIDYPETETFSITEEYAGPMNKMAFYLAVVLRGNDGVRINDCVAYWDIKIGFFGTGIHEFEKLRRQVLKM